MDSRKTISAELSEISPMLEGIAASAPFAPPPPGYFEGLAAEILARIYAENDIEAFYAPRILSPELALNRPFSIPDGYFDELPQRILSLVKTENAGNSTEELELLSPVLAKLDKKMPFSLPAGYFESIISETKQPALMTAGSEESSALLSKISYDERSSLLNNISRVNLYEVPANYFQELPAAMLNNVRSQQSGKVVDMGWGRKIMRFAAAAIAAGLILTGGWLYMNNGDQEVKTNNTVAAAKNAATDQLPAGIQKLSETEMASYLETEGAPLSDDAYASGADISSDDMLEMLADVPDEALQQYLRQYSDGRNSNVN